MNEVQDVCHQIASICRRLAGPWEAAAADMNLHADKRTEAASNHARLLKTALVIETYHGDSTIEQRLTVVEQCLSQAAALVRYQQQRTTDNDQRRFLNELRAIIDKSKF